MRPTKLTRIILDGVSGETLSTTNATFSMKSKLAVRSKASRKAWKVRKRLAAARAAQAQGNEGREAKAA